MILMTEEIAKNNSNSHTEIIQDTTKYLKKDYFQPDAFVFSALEKSTYLFSLYYSKAVISPIKEDDSIESDAFLQQGDFIGLGNEMFEGSKPLTGEAYDILIKVWERSLKNTSIIEGML